MSIRLMTKVFDGAPYGGGTFIVLLALADWANDAGERIFPHIETLAAKARLSVKQTRAVLKTLVEDGFLIEGCNTGGGRGKRLDYKINVERFTKLPSLEEAEVSASQEGSLPLESGKSAPAEGKSAPAYIDNHQAIHQENPSTHPPALAVVAPSDLELAVQAFNQSAETCPKWTSCISTSHARRAAILARLKEHGLDGWRRAVALAAASGHLGGPVPTSGTHQGWRMDIGWFAKAEHFGKILEGGYAPAKVQMNSREASRAGLLEGIGELDQ